MVPIDLRGKVALITGASRGIGRTTAKLFAEAGAQVAITHSRSAEAAASVAGEIGKDRCFAIQADMASPDDVKRMIDATVERFGRLDILVNNAAVFTENLFEGPDYAKWQEGWRRTFEVNIFGPANAAFLAIRQMKRNGGGKIINVSSRAAFRGETEFADYGASKAALANLTKSIARACAKDGITSSCVTPGFIETEMAAELLARDHDEIVGQIPLGRVGAESDVAGVVLFLASSLGDYLNGVTIDVNGGSYLR